MITVLTKTKELVDNKEEYREEGGRINMCRAIRELIEDGKLEGKVEGKAEGRVEGRKRINELNRRLLRDGRQDDMIKAVQDAGYQEQLLKEYRL